MIVIIIGISVIIAAIDQIIKYFIYNELSPNRKITVIDNLFSLVYTENRGVAFGMFQNMQWLFAIITLVIMIFLLYLYISGKMKGKLFSAAVVLVVGGGLGNMIDRIFRGFVIDYLSLSFFPPICNFADYCITIGAVLFVIYMFMFTSDTEESNGLKNVKSSDGGGIDGK